MYFYSCKRVCHYAHTFGNFFKMVMCVHAFADVLYIRGNIKRNYFILTYHIDVCFQSGRYIVGMLNHFLK